MSEHQPDLPPSFNPSTYRRPAPRDRERAETKRLGLIVLGIVGLLVVGVLARTFMVARAPATATRDATGTPVIAAASAPVKVAPATPGGLQVPGADQDVLAGAGAGAAKGQLAPGPEAPAPDKIANAPPPVKAPPVVQRPVVAAISPPPVVTKSSLGEARGEPPLPRPVARVPFGSGAQQVQLGALASEADARTEWRRLKAKLPTVLRGHSMRITAVVLNGRTLYRLRTGGFADRADARRFCTEVRDQGGHCGVF